MISLSGLSATYPGYQDEQDKAAKTAKTIAETQANQTKQRDAAIKMLGANVLGQSLAAGNGPQAPPPGQASVPAPRPMPAPGMTPPAPPTALPPQGAPGVQPGGPTPPQQPPVPVPAPGAGGAPPPTPMTGKMGIQPMVQQILRTTPGVANHPEILLAALNHAKDMGILDPEAEAKVDEANKLHTTARVAAAKGHLKAATDMAMPAAPVAGAPVAGSTTMPTATDPKTGAKVQWDGKAWQPLTN